MHILFYDVATPKCYTDQTRLREGLGGTEATITRIAHALAAHGHAVTVAQHCRKSNEDVKSNGVHYVSLKTADTQHPDAVILLRDRKWLKYIGDTFPRARRFFWLHNMPSKKLYDVRHLLIQYHFEIIAVSQFHQKQIQKRLKGKWYQRLLNPFQQQKIITVHKLFNPIDDSLNKNNTPVNMSKLFFASRPDKGLDSTLQTFTELLKYCPEFELSIATYAEWDKQKKLPPQVKFLGSLSQTELMQHIRESFCVFYPQTIRCETFGLIYAESNAVGTPVLAHDFGAAREVLSNPEQLINGKKTNKIIEKIISWKKNRPIVQANPSFRLSHVCDTWLNLLNN